MKENLYIQLLKQRDFMSFWGSTTLLRLASNVLQFALAIYVLDLTGSAFVYSTVLAIIIVPRILCTSFAGYLADFKDSIRLLRWGTLGMSVLMACFFAIHTLAFPLTVPMIYALVSCLELCETFLGPTEGKVLLCVVTEEEIAPASKLSSLDDGIVELLSPVVGALCYSWFGMTGVLGIALVLESTACVLSTCIRHRVHRKAAEEVVPEFSLKNALGAYRETVLSLKKHSYVIGIILFAPLFNFFISPLFSVVAPHYFRVTMQADVNLYAMFNTLLGIAGLAAPFLAMFLINDQDEYKANKGGTVISAAVLLCLSTILYFGQGVLPAQVALYAVTGAMAVLVAVVTVMNIATSITIKKRIPEQMMGRVISVIQLCATISVPLGQLFYGMCTDRFPVTIAFLISTLGLVITLIIMVRTYRSMRQM